MRGSEGLLAVLFAFHVFGVTEGTTVVEACAAKVDPHGIGGIGVSKGSEGTAILERPGQCHGSVTVRPLSLVQIKSKRQKTVLLEEEDSDLDVRVLSQTATLGKPVPQQPVKLAPRVVSVEEKVGLPRVHASHASRTAELPAAPATVTAEVDAASTRAHRNRAISTRVNASLEVGSLLRASSPVPAAVVPVTITAAVPAPATAAVTAPVAAAAPAPATAAVTAPVRAAVPAAATAELAKHNGQSWSLAELSLSLSGWAGRTGLVLFFIAMMACAALIGLSLAQEEKATEASPLSADALTAPPPRSSPEIRPSGPKRGPPSMGSVQATLPATSHVPNLGSSQKLLNTAEASRPSLAPAAAQVKEDNFFCRDLVVPPNCECVLRVPISRLSQGPFDVTDMNKNVVLRVEPRSAPPDSGSSNGSKEHPEPETDPQHLVLMTAFGNILAHCGPSLVRSAWDPRLRGSTRSLSSPQKIKEFQLVKSSGEEFANVTRDDEATEQRYVLSMRTGKCLHFQGNFKDYLISVTGDKHKLVARTEMLPPEMPGASMQWYKVHVTSLADAGLILCGLFCAQLLLP